MLFALSCLALTRLASAVSQTSFDAETPQGVDFYSPIANGGSELDNSDNGLGEPLNVCKIYCSGQYVGSLSWRARI